MSVVIWRITAATDMKTVVASHGKCMRKIQRIFWLNQQVHRYAATVCEDKDTEMEMDRKCPAERLQ